METILKEAAGALIVVCLYVVLPIGGAAKLARVSIAVAFSAWAVYFGGFIAWMSMEGSNWSEAFGWIMILNIFTGFGVLPTTIVAWIINKIASQ